MRQMKILISRNITLFLKNRTNVLLCSFTIVIVIGLYVLFLRDFILKSVAGTGLSPEYVYEFTDRLMVSGLLIVLNITTSFGIMQLNVADHAKGVQKDFLVAPISRFQLELGYWFGSATIAFFFTVLTLLGSETYFICAYGNRVRLLVLMKSILTVLYASFMNSGLLLCVIKFIKDTTSFSTFGNLYGMLSGFLAGTYLPYAMYPEKMKNILFYFPPMQLTSVMRQLYLSVYTKGTEAVGKHLYEVYGVTLIKNGTLFTMREQWSYLICAMAVILVIIRIEYREEKRRFRA